MASSTSATAPTKKLAKTAEDNPAGDLPATTSSDKTDKAKNPFLTSDQARDAYEDAWKWYRVYMNPLDELERIARNRPSPTIDPSLPRITDGTTAGIILETPKRVFEQVPTGHVINKDAPELAPIADTILREKLLFLYNRQGNLLQKTWNMIGKSMTYGVASSYTFFTSTNGKMHTDFILPYAKDSFAEKGKVYQPDSNFRFLRSWYTKRDIKAIIDREQRLEKTLKGYKTPYDLPKMADWMESGPQQKPVYLMTPAEKEKGGDTGGYEMIHVFQKGVGANFFGFAPRFAEGQNLYVKPNPDPRGAMPIDDLYCNIDLSNPMGRGQVELCGGLQNLMDQQMQLYQFMSTIMQGPPLQTWGNVNKATLKYRPNAIWDMGSNMQNKVEPVQITNEQIKTFVPNMQFLAGKINMINATQDSAIPQSAGTTTSQSKTHAGVQQQVERLGVSDNYLQMMAEAWFKAQSETSLNLYFANMKGKEKVDVGEQSVKDLEGTVAAKYVKVDPQTNNATLNIDYDKLDTAVLSFHVDAGTSKKLDDAEQLAKLQTVLQDVGTNGRVISWFLSQEGKKLNFGDIYKQMLERIGLTNLDTILSDMTPEETQAAKQQPYPLFDMPKLSAKYEDLPPSAQVGFLAGAGIQVNAQEVMQAPIADPNVRGQAQAIGDQVLSQMHPALQQMQALGWKPNDLPPDTMNAVLGLLGLPANGQSPAQLNAQSSATKAAHDIVTNHAKTALAAAQEAHRQGMEVHKTAMADVQTGEMQPAQPAQPASSGADGSQTAPAQPAQDPQLTPGAPGVGDISHHTNPLNPQETQIAHQLIQHGFSDQDVEQAIVMLRQGMPMQQVIQTLGAKHAGAPA